MFSQFKQKIESTKFDNKLNTFSKKIVQNIKVLNGAGGSPNKNNQGGKDRDLKLSFSNSIFIPPPLPAVQANPNLFKVSSEYSELYGETPFSFYYEDFGDDDDGEQTSINSVNLTVKQEIPTIQPEPMSGLHPYGFQFEEYNRKRMTMNPLADSKPHFLRIDNENPIKNYSMTPANARILSINELMNCLQSSSITYICITDLVITRKEKRAFLKKLSSFSNVETLILKGCRISSFANGTRFPVLRFADLSNNSIKWSTGIKKLIKYSPWIEFLNLSGNPIHTNVSAVEWDQRVMRMSSIFPQLESVNNKSLSVDVRIKAIQVHGPSTRRSQIDKIRWELHLDGLNDVRASRGIVRGWQPEAILQIDLNNCQLRYFYVGAMINLNSLNLASNFITDISNSGLEKCTFLQYVNLSDNSLSRMDVTTSIFEFTPSIRHVILSGNIGLTIHSNNSNNHNNQTNYRKELIYNTRNNCGTNRSIGIQQIDNQVVGIEEKVSVVHEYELRKNGGDNIAATKTSSELRWKLLIIEKFGHNQLQSIPRFFDYIKHISFSKCNLLMVDAACFNNIEIIDFSGNDLQSFTGLSKLFNLRVLLLQDNPKLDSKQVVDQLVNLTRLESINMSVTSIDSHSRNGKNSTSLEHKAYRAQVLGGVIPNNRSFVLLDNTSITYLERVEAYSTAGYSFDLVEKYRFFLALTVNCTLPFNRKLYPDQVEIGQQYDPTQVTILRRLRDWSISSEVINFSCFSNVQEIDLTNNKLTSILNIGLQSLNNLSKLCLINNQINNPLPLIAQLLDGMKSLEILAIRGNPCMRNPADRLSLIGHMSTMKSTIPQENFNLKVIDTEITIYDKVEGWKLVGGSIQDAEMLKLSYVVKFKSIDLFDHAMVNLELCDCALEYLDVTPLVNLRALLLANNKFKNINSLVGLSNCQQLFALDLRNNQIDSISDAKALVLSLPNLMVIGLSGNNFTKPSNSSSSSSTSQIHNYRPKLLAQITPLSQTHLYPLSILDSNEITPDEIVESSVASNSDSKKELLFQVCLLRKSISPDYSSLTELDLSGCQLTYCNFLNLPNLIILSLSDNNISDSNIKDSSLTSLSNLKALDLRNNRLKDLSIICKIIDLLNIETLFIEENSCFEKDNIKERIRFFKKLTNSRVLSTLKYLNGIEVSLNDTVQFGKTKKK